MSNEIITFIIVAAFGVLGFYGVIVMIRIDNGYTDLINEVERELYGQKKELNQSEKQKQNEQ
jgi:hypothetical protein